MAICGSTCSISGSGLSAIEGHRFSIELGANEIDIRAFGSGEYGDFIACAKNGTMTVDSYVRPDVDINSTLTISASVGAEAYSIPCLVTSQSINVDAKDVVQFTTKMRITGNLSIS